MKENNQETQETRESDLRQPYSADSEQASIAILGSTALQVLSGFLNLAWLELAQAVRTAPKILALTLVAFALSIFAWIAFSVTVGWVVYHLTQYAVLAPIAVLLLHIAALGICWGLRKHYAQQMSFQNTRREWHHLQELVHEANQTDS